MDRIKMLILDVDGTMTDGRINVLDDGNQFKQFHAQDGLGIRMLLKKEVLVGVVSHSFVPNAIESRAKALGIPYVVMQGSKKKMRL